VNFFRFLDAGHFDFDEVLFEGVAEVQIWLVRLFFWFGVATGNILQKILVLVMSFMGVVYQWCFGIVRNFIRVTSAYRANEQKDNNR